VSGDGSVFGGHDADTPFKDFHFEIGSRQIGGKRRKPKIVQLHSEHHVTDNTDESSNKTATAEIRFQSKLHH
jgi:hypothetical protein